MIREPGLDFLSFAGAGPDSPEVHRDSHDSAMPPAAQVFESYFYRLENLYSIFANLNALKAVIISPTFLIEDESFSTRTWVSDYLNYFYRRHRYNWESVAGYIKSYISSDFIFIIFTERKTSRKKWDTSC